MKRFTERLLHLIEVVYLEAHGWKPTKQFGTTYWTPPEGYWWSKKQGEEHNHGHAVNSQKAATGEERRIKELRAAGIWKEKEEDGNRV